MVAVSGARSIASASEGSAPGPTVQTRRRRRTNWGDVAAYVILSIWMVFTLFPVVWLLMSSVKEPNDVFAMPPKWIFTPTLHNYGVVLGLEIPTELETVTESQVGTASSPFPRFFFNTVVVAFGTTVLSLSLGSAAAYALTRFFHRQRTSLLMAIMVTRL